MYLNLRSKKTAAPPAFWQRVPECPLGGFERFERLCDLVDAESRGHQLLELALDWNLRDCHGPHDDIGIANDVKAVMRVLAFEYYEGFEALPVDPQPLAPRTVGPSIATVGTCRRATVSHAWMTI